MLNENSETEEETDLQLDCLKYRKKSLQGTSTSMASSKPICLSKVSSGSSSNNNFNFPDGGWVCS